MKVMQTCERKGFAKPISQQIHDPAQAREAGYDVLPATCDQGLGT